MTDNAVLKKRFDDVKDDNFEIQPEILKICDHSLTDPETNELKAFKNAKECFRPVKQLDLNIAPRIHLIADDLDCNLWKDLELFLNLNELSKWNRFVNLKKEEFVGNRQYNRRCDSKKE